MNTSQTQKWKMKKVKTGNIFTDIRKLFCKVFYYIDIANYRPAFIRHIDKGYFTINNDFDSLIINIKKEVDSMDARNLVLIQLEALKKEKEELVAKVVEAENEKIEAIKLKAAEEAEALYKKQIEDKVTNQFKIAEEHLTKLLESLPESIDASEKTEVENDESENTEEAVI